MPGAARADQARGMTNLRRILFVGDPGEPRAQAASGLAGRLSATLAFLPAVVESAATAVERRASDATGAVATLDPPRLPQEVVITAAEQRADLIIAGEHVPGEVALRLAAESGRPVFVPPESSAGLPRRPNILVGLADHGDTDAIVGATTRLAQALGGRLTLVHVVELGSLDTGWRVLASAVRLITPHTSASATVLVGDPAGELLNAAEERQADIVAVGVPGDLPAGPSSVAASVLDDPGYPVLLVP
jgi:nucleotide-binding universal stress UspA family protein